MNEIKSFYKLLPKKYIKKYHNPNFKQHGISIPFRMLIVGASGSGKTNTLMNLIRAFNGTFEHIILCLKNKDEPLYQFFIDSIPKEFITVCEGVAAIPALDSLGNKGQQLIVFDDLVNEKNQKPMEDAYIRARKIGGGISCVYLTQSYFKTPKTIRVNCNYIILKKLSSTRDLNMILSDYNLGVDKAQLIAIFKYATQNPLDFLLIDIDAPTADRFRRNFNEILEGNV